MSGTEPLTGYTMLVNPHAAVQYSALIAMSYIRPAWLVSIGQSDRDCTGNNL